MKIRFSTSTKRFQFATFAVAKTGEAPIDAVTRSIARTTKQRVHFARLESWSQNRRGERTDETYSVTLTENTQSRRGGGWGVVAEFRVYLYL